MAFDRLKDWHPFELPDRYAYEELKGTTPVNRILLLFMDNYKYKKGQKIKLKVFIDPRAGEIY